MCAIFFGKILGQYKGGVVCDCVYFPDEWDVVLVVPCVGIKENYIVAWEYRG